MTLPILLAFCASSDRERVLEAANRIPLYALFTDAAHAMAREVPRPLILLAIGPEGSAALARWVDAHGLDGVRGVGLVGVTAPWAERVPTYHAACSIPGCDHEESEALPLGPLEPLRAAAERARRGNLCPKHFYLHPDENCEPSAHGVKLVVACAPDDGVCGVCDGIGDMPHFSGEQCKACDGEGKALSSAQVASELVGVDVGSTTDSIASGGTWVDVYSSNVALADHGLRSVIETLTR